MQLIGMLDSPYVRRVSAAAERLPEFAAAPHGDGVCHGVTPGSK